MAHFLPLELVRQVIISEWSKLAFEDAIGLPEKKLIPSPEPIPNLKSNIFCLQRTVSQAQFRIIRQTAGHTRRGKYKLRVVDREWVLCLHPQMSLPPISLATIRPRKDAAC